MHDFSIAYFTSLSALHLAVSFFVETLIAYWTLSMPTTNVSIVIECTYTFMNFYSPHDLLRMVRGHDKCSMCSLYLF